MSEEGGYPKEVVPQLAKKLEAEALAAQAEARKLDAEAQQFQAEAQKLHAETQQAEINARTMTRKEQDELAGNKYHHVYAFNDPVYSSSVGACMTQLNIWSRTDPGCDIEIVFNSPGGSVIDGMALYDFIQTLRRKGHKITTGTLGMAASMAGILLQAGDVRYIGRECPISDQSVLMQDLTWKSAGQLEVGDAILAFDEHRGDGYYIDGRPGVKSYRSWRPTVVTAVGRAVRPCYEVRLADGHTEVVSENHAWLGSGGSEYVRTKHMNKNGAEHPTKVKRLVDVTKPLPDWDAGWMAGILDGEGCFAPGKRGGQGFGISVVQSVGHVLDEIKRWFDAHGFRYYINAKEAIDNHKARENLFILGGLEETTRLLSLVRPKRFLPRVPEAIAGRRLTGSWVSVKDIVPVGPQEVVSLATGTGTYVGGGLAQHNSYVLIHEISTGAIGKIGEIEDTVEFVKKIQKRVVQIFEARSKKSAAYFEKHWRRKDWWLSSEECMNIGIVDEVR